METNIQLQSNTLLTSIERLLQKRPVVLQLLKFCAIGVINSALDFLVLNFLSKWFGISSGWQLGVINVVSFSLAVIQSFMWNKSWAFGDMETSPIKNFFRLCFIAGLGGIAVILVLVGSRLGATSLFYGLLAVIFLLSEVVLWHVLGLHMQGVSGGTKQFGVFILVSVIGLIINSLVLVVASGVLLRYEDLFGNADVVKNIAKILAIGVSLVWNFIGYKLFVFRK